MMKLFLEKEKNKCSKTDTCIKSKHDRYITVRCVSSFIVFYSFIDIGTSILVKFMTWVLRKNDQDQY